MHLIAPDILSDGKGLSALTSGAGLAVGLLIWLLGGWSHRFWLVLLTTLGAGVYGLSIGEAFGVQPLVAALLLAVAAGTLALSLVRVAAFVAGGVTLCLVAEHLVSGWNEPFAFFFVGGFLALFLFRFWLMALSSFAGTVVMAYSALWLLDTLGKIDAVSWSVQKPVLLNWACGGVALLGLFIQLTASRRSRRKHKQSHAEDGDRKRVRKAA